MTKQRFMPIVFALAILIGPKCSSECLTAQDDWLKTYYSYLDSDVDPKQKIGLVEHRLNWLALVQKSLEEKLAELQATQSDLQQKRGDALARLDGLDISPASYDEVMRFLQSQRVQLSIDLAGLEARREAIAQARGGGAGKPDPSRDEILSRLSKLVELQRTKLDEMRALYERAGVAAGEVRDVEKQLLEAEIRLAEFTSPFRAAEQQQFNDQMMAISLESAEKQARLKKIEELLKQFSQARQVIEALNWLDRQTSDSQAANGEVKDAIMRNIKDIQAATEMKLKVEALLKGSESEPQSKDDD